MVHTSSRLSVFFEAPFWVGVYERQCDGELEAAKVVFGAEPKDQEVYAYFLTHWDTLSFSPPVDYNPRRTGRISCKRMGRAIQKEQDACFGGTGTKAQQALKLWQEQQRQVRKDHRRQSKAEQKEHRFALQQQKKKEKHRGR